MSSDSRDYFRSEGGYDAYAISTPAVKSLIIVNCAIYFLTLIVGNLSSFGDVYDWLGFVPQRVLEGHRYWQVVTYAFIHDINPLHLLFNMIFLWLAGREVETLLSTRGFLTFYALAALVSALCYATSAYIIQDAKAVPMVGASGAIMGVLVLFAIYYPTAELPVLFISLQARFAVAIYIAIDVAMLLSAKQSCRGVASFAHLAGAAFGFVWYKTHPRVSDFFADLERKLEKKEREEARDLEKRMDEVLRRVSEVGMDGLSSEDKALLDRASHHFRRNKKS